MRPFHKLLIVVLSLFIVGAGSAFSQTESAFRFLGGTVFEDTTTGDKHAYLLWQSQDPSLLRGRAFAAFTKPGAANVPNAFAPRGVFQLRTRPVILNDIIDNAPDGFINDLALLEATLTELFGDLVPDPALDLGHKLAAVMQSAVGNQDNFNRLLFLSRAEPIIGVCLGVAALVPMESSSNLTTIELRTRSAGDASPAAPFDTVSARITLDHTNPTILPPPPSPDHLVDFSPKGHLNARFRWPLTDELKRLTPLTYGYNLYRIDRAYAEGKGLVANPPSSTQIGTLLNGTPSLVRKINELPLVPSADLGALQSADSSFQPDTFFALDNNNALTPDSTAPPFNDGDQFYYYLAARDLLGRPGDLSIPTLVTICKTHPPKPPTGLKVTNHYAYTPGTGATTQRLRVSFKLPDVPDVPATYHVYRWTSIDEMNTTHDPAQVAAHLVSPIIVLGAEAGDTVSLTDNGPGAPDIATDLGRTFWYSVRSVENNACGHQLLSADSSPAFGVLRDRKGPGTGTVNFLSYKRFRPTIALADTSTSFELGNPDDYLGAGARGTAVHFQFNATRLDDRIAEAQFYLSDSTPNAAGETPLFPLGGGTFSPGLNTVTAKFRILDSEFNAGSTKNFLVVGTDLRGRQVFAQRPFSVYNDSIGLDDKSLNIFDFELDEVMATFTVAGDNHNTNDTTHDSVIPGSNGDVNPTAITFRFPNTAREFKIYKRIDGGPLQLVEQGTDATYTQVFNTINDLQLPAHAAEVCYFIQYFDEHGNPSKLQVLGCIQTSSRVALQQPILSPITRIDGAAVPKASLAWFCPPYGVERFRVLISEGNTRTSLGTPSDDLSPVTETVAIDNGTPPLSFGTLAAPVQFIDGQPFRVYQTGRIGGNFNGSDFGQFALSLLVKRERTYTIRVQAVSPAGDLGPLSAPETYTWSPENPVAGPEIPWPARALPPLDNNFIPFLQAEFLADRPPVQTTRAYAGIRIGTLDIRPSADPSTDVSIGFVNFNNESGLTSRVPTTLDGADNFGINLFQSESGETIFPCVVYRYQVPSAFFPSVSGDVVQVSPLIDRFRYEIQNGAGTGGVDLIAVHDPFIDLARADGNDPDSLKVYLRDTQGVVKGASYRYLITRFKPNGEIDRIIKTNAVNIPLD